jgi:hypothetical protein
MICMQYLLILLKVRKLTHINRERESSTKEERVLQKKNFKRTLIFLFNFIQLGLLVS